MSQRNITDLRIPLQHYRIDKARVPKGKKPFETEAQARAEDLIRAKMLYKFAATCDNVDLAFYASYLAEHLERGAEGGSPPATPASKLYMRDQRIRIIGEQQRFLNETPLPWTTFTLIPNSGAIDEGSLFDMSAASFMGVLRSDMNRVGAAKADGFLFASMHGEYDVTLGEYRLHYHGHAGGGMLDLIDKLRDRKRFKLPEKEAGAPGKLRPPIQVRRKRLKNMPYPLTYGLQPYWPHHPTKILDTGEQKRAGHRWRIPEPAHSMHLLWLDRQNLSQMTLLMGLRVTKDGLLPTKL